MLTATGYNAHGTGILRSTNQDGNINNYSLGDTIRSLNYDAANRITQSTDYLIDNPAQTSNAYTYYYNAQGQRIKKHNINATTYTANEDPNNTGNLFTYNLRFPGQLYDSETKTHYNYFRDHYAPDIGRYKQSDPIGLEGGINTYGYVGGSPIGRVDSLGLADFLEECTGRYSTCSVTQHDDASTVGNWLRLQVCKNSINEACSRTGTYCCQEEQRVCVGTAEDTAVVAKCTIEFQKCVSKIK